MLRVFLALNLLLLSLFACKGGYKSCKAKTTNLNVIQNQTLQVPLKHNQLLIYSTSPLNAKIIKYDPFLNLYLVKNKRFVRFPFRINNKISLGKACVNKQMFIEGRMKNKQIGLNKLANFTEVVSAPSLLLSSCCSLEGLVTPRGIIQREYLSHFINSKESTYGDIGIRVKDDGKYVIIKRVDPFEKNMDLKVGDCITHLNGKKVKDASSFMMDILFSKLGSKCKLTIVREGKIMTITRTSQKRYGGGYVSDTFLESKGLYFSENLTILKAGDEYKKYGLQAGDRLLQVNGVKVNSISDIRENIDSFKHFARLLFSRRHFQFFVNINP